jgi:uncharacterized damage-inducible protein DinB
METEIQNIVSLLKKSFEKGAWHGASVMEALEAVSPEQAFSRLPDTHSIMELVAHMTAWKKYVSRKLRGDVGYKVTDEMNFAVTGDWNSIVQQLRQSQAELTTAIEAFPASKLQERMPGAGDDFTWYAVIHGIIHHDLYHTGQINLIKKVRAQTS